MKTDDLINAIIADTAVKQRPIGQTLLAATLVGLAASGVYFAVMMGARPGAVASLMTSWQFAFKFVFTLTLAGVAYLLVNRASRPEGRLSGIAPFLVVPPLMLAAAIGFEMTGQSPLNVDGIVFSPNWMVCVTLIPVLSLAPLVMILYALRQGAPANPSLAGALGGLLSGALGATLYAAHCTEDSPLFVGIWYPLTIIAVTALGALVGSRLLRW